MDVEKTVTKFIENNIDLIEQNTKQSWQELYKKLYEVTNGWMYDQVCGLFSTIMLKCDLDPAERLEYIPRFYLYQSDIDKYDIPGNVTTIGDHAFANCKNLKTIVIPPKVDSIGEFAFYSCSQLQTVYIPKSVTYIGERCFMFCNDIDAIYCEATEEPPHWAKRYNFEWNYTCYGGVVWDYNNNSRTKSGNLIFRQYPFKCIVDPSDKACLYVLKEADNESTLVVPSTVSYQGTTYEVVSVRCESYLTNLKVLELPDTIKSVYEFNKCKQLSEIKNSDKIRRLDGLNGCTNLETIDLSNIESISDTYYSSTLAGCTSLNKVVFGNKISELGYNIFSNSTNLKEILFKGTKKEAMKCGIGNKTKKKWRSNSEIERIICTDGVIEL